jgi:23S rRNA (cytosine1962-C5)-methyltransferase
MDGRTPLSYPNVVLKPKEEGRLQGGHLWAFSNEIAQAPDSPKAGMLADLFHAKNGFIGRGFYHPHSLIAFRVLTDQKDQLIDESFLIKRFEAALSYRETFYTTGHAYRWIFGESDRLPGLVVDRYGDVLCVQAIAAGMEILKPLILSALIKVSGATGIVWRADAGLREMEGLPIGKPEVVFGKVPARVQIETENGIFLVDPLEGQKTGFYFDQRDNRQALAAYCKDKRVLDAFCYSGGFGVAAGRAGARQVVFADSAQPALELAEANAGLNGIADKSIFVQGDALELLAHENPDGPFDVVSVDPPAYARSKKHLPAALKAYEKLNMLAMRSVKRGGIVASSSCSHHVTRDLFVEMLRRSARKATRQVRLLELRSQAKDHPMLLSMPETEYLKCAILQVL